MEIGKNVMIDLNVDYCDFCESKVESGKSVFKGGVCE
jgi:hypothetical protein